MRRACSGDYYCLRETVIAEKRKLSLVSRHHLLFGNLHENQHQPSERRDVPALLNPLGRFDPSTCAWQHGAPSTAAAAVRAA